MTPVPRRAHTSAPKALSCTECSGSGQITVPVFAGRGARRRQLAKQEATCLDCLGTGMALGEPE
ncbi:hypothetical protein GCM10009663_50600 [Kitasatospora arboriphila]|uniref:Molecular chaperone DnaJ n=1 Tax=Kitasatospora arboriphila TaxID=258052 RepID=A0ABN1TUW2_9ACTN